MDLELVSCSADTKLQLTLLNSTALQKWHWCELLPSIWHLFKCISNQKKKGGWGAAPAYCKSVFNHGKASAYQVTVWNCWCYQVPTGLCQTHYPCILAFPVTPGTRGAESSRAVLFSYKGWARSSHCWVQDGAVSPPSPTPHFRWSLKLHLVNGFLFEAVTYSPRPPSLCKVTTANPSASRCFTEFGLEKRRKQTPPHHHPPPPPQPVPPISPTSHPGRWIRSQKCIS